MGRKQTLETKRKISKSLGGNGISSEDRICPSCGKVGIYGKQCKNCAPHMIPSTDTMKKLNLLNLHYEDELGKLLSHTYGDLEKEQINGSYFDFCNDSVVIEFTFDATHGTSDVIERFKKIPNEARRKIAFVPDKDVGPLRRSRLSKLGVHIRCSDEFRYLL